MSKNQKNQKKINYLLIIGIIILLLVGIFLTFYYFNYQNNKCIQNPLVYGAKQIESQYGSEFIGLGFLKTPPNKKYPIIFFNSTTYWLEN